MQIWVDIEDSAGAKLGPGPVTSALEWESTRRLNAAGEFSFKMPAGDSRADWVRAKRVARCWGIVNGEVQELGAGVIDKLEHGRSERDGVLLSVSGDDLLRELTYRSVGDLQLFDTRTDHPAQLKKVVASPASDTVLSNAFDLAVGDATTYTSFSLSGDPHTPNEFLYVGYMRPFDRINLVFGAAVNNNQVTAKWQYYNAESIAWETVEVTTDGTDTGAAGAPVPFGQTGMITFDSPTGWGIEADGVYLLRCSFSGAIDTVDLADCSVTLTAPTTDALSKIMAFAPPGWSLDAVHGYTATSGAATAGSELVTNGGFETAAGTADDGTSDTFTGWTNSGVNDGAGNKVESTLTAQAGSKAVLLTYGNAQPYVYQDLTLAANTTYVLTFYARGDGTRQGSFRLQRPADSRWLCNPVDTGVTAAAWSLVTYEFTTPAGWTTVRLILYAPRAAGACYFDAVSVLARGPGSVYLEMAGESVLEALARVAEQTGEKFINGYSGRTVVWLGNDDRDLPVRAIQGPADGGDVSANGAVCLITSLSEEQDAYELVSRAIPHGGGMAEARVTLADTTRVAPAGYTLSKANNYLKRDAAETALGRIEKDLQFGDINAADTSAAQLQNAADALFDRCYEWLVRHSATNTARIGGDVPKAYDLSVTKADRIIWPGHRLWVEYREMCDSFIVLNIRTWLYVLEAVTKVDNSGIRTAGLKVSTVDVPPANDALALVAEVRQGRALRAHPSPQAALVSSESGVPYYIAVEDGKVLRVLRQTPVGDKTYRLSISGGDDGQITVVNGVITAIQEAT